MARRTAGMGNRTFVTTTAAAVDLVNADGDVATGMLCPGDGAKVVTLVYTVQTTGGDAQNHALTLEHGLTTDGVALSEGTLVANDDAAGVITTGIALAPTAQPNTVYGTMIQIRNVEGGAISNGLILDVSVLWEL